MKYSKDEKQKAYEFLKKFKGQIFAANVTSVSRSGLSRRIRIFALNFIDLSYYIAVLLDLHYNKKGIKVDGAGMDMIFHLLSNLNYKMAILDTGKSIKELLDTKECGEFIYNNYYTDANKYIYIGE